MTDPSVPTRVVGSGSSAHELIEPPNKLKDKVKPIRQIHGQPIEDPVARAERELKKLEPQFDEWITSDISRLKQAWEDYSAASEPADREAEEPIAPLFRAAHDLKGQAATYGKPYIATVAASLCMILEDPETLAVVPPALIEQHVNAIAAMHRESSEPSADDLASRLSEELTKIAQSFVAADRSERLKVS